MIRLVLVTVTLLTLVLVGCGGAAPTSTPTPTPTLTPTPTPTLMGRIEAAVEAILAGNEVEHAIGREICAMPRKDVSDSLAARIALTAYCTARGFN